MNAHITALLGFLEEDPSDTFSRYALALEYIKMNDTDAGMQHLNRIVDEHPEYLAAYYQLGKLLQQKGELNKAISVYEKGKIIARQQDNIHTLGELNAALDDLVE